nr:tripartite tricarboxylate transporter permease [Halomonas socia]
MDIPFGDIGSIFVNTLGYWWLIIPAVFIGILMGAIPGFAAHNTIIILLPLTLAFNVEMALVFMVSLYCASHLGGGVPAILMNIPGTGGAAATTLDGYQMTQNGHAAKALALSFIASVFGGIITTAITILALPILGQIGYHIQSVEMVIIMLFGLALIAAIAAKDLLKGLVAGSLGLMLGAMGANQMHSLPRGTFGSLQLFDGLPLVPVLVGLFAISEALVMIEKKSIIKEGADVSNVRPNWGQTLNNFFGALKHWWMVVWASVLGLLIGVLPGAGASIAAFVAYQQAQMFSKTPEKFGTGHEQGVIAPEAANNGVTTGTMIPLLAIGIPGGSTAAVMMVVLQFHGFPFGPRLFVEQPTLAYGIIMAMMVAYIFMLLAIFPMARYLSRITAISTLYLGPMIVAFTLVGAFVPRGFVFDIGIAVAFGVIGYIARKTGFHVAAILIGVILGPLIERSFLLAMRISGNDYTVFFTSTVGNVLWVLLASTLVGPPIVRMFKKLIAKKQQEKIT